MSQLFKAVISSHGLTKSNLFRYHDNYETTEEILLFSDDGFGNLSSVVHSFLLSVYNYVRASRFPQLQQGQPMMMLKFTLFCLISYAASLDIHFKDCGNGEIKSIDFSPCDAEPCYLKKGVKTNITVTFASNQDTETSTLDATIDVFGAKFHIPIDTDGCKYVECPIKKAQTYDAIIQGQVDQGDPDITGEVTATMTGSNGIMFCASFQSGIQDSSDIMKDLEKIFKDMEALMRDLDNMI
jgi:hypothetical protein